MHAKHFFCVTHANAVFHIEVSAVIDISHSSKQIVAQIDREQFGNISLDDQIRIKIQDLAVIWQKFLDKETIICFVADMRVIRRQLILIDKS